MAVDLKETIRLDCEQWCELKNRDAMFTSHMCLRKEKEKDSGGSNFYSLVLNGVVLWWGTLEEINAVVKSMLSLLTREEDYFPWLNEDF